MSVIFLFLLLGLFFFSSPLLAVLEGGCCCFRYGRVTLLGSQSDLTREANRRVLITLIESQLTLFALLMVLMLREFGLHHQTEAMLGRIAGRF